MRLIYLKTIFFLLYEAHLTCFLHFFDHFNPIKLQSCFIVEICILKVSKKYLFLAMEV